MGCVGVRMVDKSGEMVLSWFSFGTQWTAAVRLFTRDLVNLRRSNDRKYIKRINTCYLPASVD